jgi:hypothetical protein
LSAGDIFLRESEVEMIGPWRLASLVLVSAVILASFGCGRSDLPPLGRVRGTVTLDGKPLAGVNVSFQPEKGRPAVAVTDSNGNYDVMYTPDVKGATVGPNTVRVFWPDGESGTAAIPDKYNAKTTLKFDVKPGNNTFDLKLESK